MLVPGYWMLEVGELGCGMRDSGYLMEGGKRMWAEFYKRLQSKRKERS